ncbi:MAG TPA: YdcF family protein [Pyrinomonadaceae bacterium]|jgi:uncharacterized SAM-binding protein YcdF (DUF218 family)|nr:YdcF family protein [Pyrinomonadaceae bacterium]
MAREKQFSERSRATRRRRFRFIAILLIVAAPFVAWGAARFLIVKADVASPDAIVVLSGSATYLERAAKAAELYRAGRAPLIVLTNDGVVSGWDNREDRNPLFYELSARRMEQQGVPPDRIAVAPGPATGTYDESLLVRDFAVAHGLKRLLIVTSAYHSRRALWSMRRACAGSGIEIGIDSAAPGWQTPSAWRWWSKRWGWKLVGGEYAKMIYYWTKY